MFSETKYAKQGKNFDAESEVYTSACLCVFCNHASKFSADAMTPSGFEKRITRRHPTYKKVTEDGFLSFCFCAITLQVRHK